MPSRDRPTRFGLRFWDGDIPVILVQIAGGGRIKLRRGSSDFWGRLPKDATWEVFGSDEGQTYPTVLEAQAVAKNLT